MEYSKLIGTINDILDDFSLHLSSLPFNDVCLKYQCLYIALTCNKWMKKKKTINENGRNEKQKLKELLEPPP